MQIRVYFFLKKMENWRRPLLQDWNRKTASATTTATRGDEDCCCDGNKRRRHVFCVLRPSKLDMPLVAAATTMEGCWCVGEEKLFQWCSQCCLSSSISSLCDFVSEKGNGEQLIKIQKKIQRSLGQVKFRIQNSYIRNYDNRFEFRVIVQDPNF